MDYKNFFQKQRKKIALGGIVATIGGLYFLFRKEDYCHEWNFEEETVKVCFYDTKSKSEGIYEMLFGAEKTRNNWSLMHYSDKEGNKIRSISLLDLDKDGFIDKKTEWLYGKDGYVVKSSVWKNNEE